LARAGARLVLSAIRVPTIIVTSQDDPFIPFRMFGDGALRDNAMIRLWAPERGGHCGFIQRPRPDEDIYWVENRLVEWAAEEGMGNG